MSDTVYLEPPDLGLEPPDMLTRGKAVEGNRTIEIEFTDCIAPFAKAIAFDHRSF